MQNATVVLTRSTTTTDDHGDSTTATTTATLSWALIAPRSSSERTDPHSPAVITAATLYGPYDEAPGASDTLTVSGHSPAFDGPWQVEGFPGPWSMGDWKPGFEVALTRVG